MRRVLIFGVTLSFMFLLCGLVLAQDPPVPPPQPPPPAPPAPKADDPKEPDNSAPDQKKIDAAVKKGVEWLAKQQKKDGSIQGSYGRSYPMGTTALAVLALLKSDVHPMSPAILKAFKYLDELPLNKMYSVALYVMALEAFYSPTKKQMAKSKKPYTTVLRENLKKRSGGHNRNKISKLLEWIIGHQQKNVWRYPSSGEDLSNTQYALLALYSGMRMGYRVNPKVFQKAADYMIVYQEKKGEEVEPFPVPAADFSIKDLKRLEKEIKQKLHADRKAGRPRKGKDEKSPEEPRTTVVEDPYSRFGVERRKHKMFARGWSYTAPRPPKQGQKAYPQSCTGSMTTAGLACSVIIKAGMEGSGHYTKAYKQLLNKCIRDGAAWVFKYFMVAKNPSSRSKSGSTSHLYYYLYGLERAGVLTLCTRFGKHDWYNKGAKFIMEQQKPEGYWEATPRRAPTPRPGQAPQPPPPPNHIDTCFALLFLKKATVPVISIPPEIYTGGDLFGDKTEKQEMPGLKKPKQGGEQQKQEPQQPEKDSDKPEQPAKEKKSFLGVQAADAAEGVEGAKVARVLPDTPADKAGIWEGDVIIEFNGVKIKDWNTLREEIAKTAVGQKVKVRVDRAGAIVELELETGEKP